MCAKPGTKRPRNTRPSSTAGFSETMLPGQDYLDPFAVGSLNPPIDICHTENTVFVRVELPGVDASDISVTVQNGNIRVHGTKREKGQSRRFLCYHCLERRYGKFDREIAIESVVDPRPARAYLHHGILTIELPRIEERRGEPIDIPIGNK